MILRSLPLAVLIALAGCTGQTAPTADTATETPAAAETDAQPEAAPELGDMDPSKLQEGADKKFTLVPSPVETQGALESAGIDTKLATLIEDRSFEYEDQDTDDVAVRTGVVIADMLLTVKTATDEQLVDRLQKIKKGMEVLKGGDDIQKTLDDLIDRVKGEAVNREELLKELDELSGAVIPELEFNGVERIVPLIQAGSWLEGANLVAKASKAAGKPSAADEILKQPAVVEYFITYVKTEGKEKAPAAVTEKLEASLTTLKALAEKEGSLNEEDIQTVIQVTEDVLALL
jgi:hypothetical protein